MTATPIEVAMGVAEDAIRRLSPHSSTETVMLAHVMMGVVTALIVAIQDVANAIDGASEENTRINNR